MAIILSIETSTNVCSVALSEHEKVLLSEIEYTANSHAALLTALIERMMKKAGMDMNVIDAVAVSSGPGSYTGLRIGVSTAKGICYALGKPLIAINSLRILAQQAIIAKCETLDYQDTLLCPMIDARRMEVYSTLFDSELNQIEDIRAEIIDTSSYWSILEKRKIVFAGNGSGKCKDVIQHHNAVFQDDVYPLASAMAMPAYVAFTKNQFEDVAYFEPFYLKDFIVTVGKNKVFSIPSVSQLSR